MVSLGTVTIHNNGRHLDRGIGVDKDPKWQWLQERIVGLASPCITHWSGPAWMHGKPVTTVLW